MIDNFYKNLSNKMAIDRVTKDSIKDIKFNLAETGFDENVNQMFGEPETWKKTADEFLAEKYSEKNKKKLSKQITKPSLLGVPLSQLQPKKYSTQLVKPLYQPSPARPIGLLLQDREQIKQTNAKLNEQYKRLLEMNRRPNHDQGLKYLINRYGVTK